jgi:tripartite-type tricarboxylate transporter receptor subunit TctC
MPLLSPSRRTALAAMASCAIWTLPMAPSAQTQSSKPIRLVVPYPPGGPLDIAARALADKVKDTLGPVIVDNRAGAGGNLGADAVAKAAPDGQTIVMGAVATHAINPWLYAKMPYDALADFTPITLVAQVPNVLVLNADTAQRLSIGNLRDFVAYAKRNPGKLNFGSGGNGSAGHLAGELFKQLSGVYAVHIPYAGGPAAQMGLLSGQVDFNFDNLAAASANIKSGKLKALAVTTPQRAAALPELPTLAQAGRDLGLASFDIHTWFGLFGPAKLPAETVARLHKAFSEALTSADVKTRLAGLMAEPAPMSPEAFALFVREEHAKYGRLVRATGAKAE